MNFIDKKTAFTVFDDTFSRFNDADDYSNAGGRRKMCDNFPYKAWDIKNKTKCAKVLKDCGFSKGTYAEAKQCFIDAGYIAPATTDADEEDVKSQKGTNTVLFVFAGIGILIFIIVLYFKVIKKK